MADLISSYHYSSTQSDVSPMDFTNIGFNLETAVHLATRYNYTGRIKFTNVLPFAQKHILDLNFNNSQQLHPGDNLFSFLTRNGISEALCQELFHEKRLNGRERINERNMNLIETMLNVKLWLMLRVSSAFRAMVVGPSANSRPVPLEVQVDPSACDRFMSTFGLWDVVGLRDMHSEPEPGTEGLWTVAFLPNLAVHYLI